MCFTSSSVSLSLFILCFLFPLSSATAFNITEIFDQHPDFSTFSTYLSKTQLADSINGGRKITVLAVDNRAMSKFSAESAEEVERLLRVHLIRGYYRARNLLQLSTGSASLPTLSREGTVQVKILKNGGVGFSAAGEGSGLSAELVKHVFSHPKTRISVLQISDLLKQQGNNGTTHCLAFCASARSKKVEASPINTIFKLPSPLPSWPTGEGFASGTIDLGGLLVQQITSFTKIWATHQGGPDDLGATFFEPSVLPEGYFMLGSYAQPNNRALFGGILIGKDGMNKPTNGALKKPIDYTLVWSSESLKINQEGNGYIWLPVPPDGYKAVGYVVTTSSQKPSTDKVQCVRSNLTDQCEIDTWVWGNGNALNIFTSRPSIRGTEARGVGVGAFFAQTGPNSSVLACLRNTKYDMSYMPNHNQIEALVQAYSPLVYFHPDEAFLPSSVDWLFANGALLYKKGEEAKPAAIELTGSNLPQGGSSDGAYWLDLPSDGAAKDRVKRGNLQSSQTYLHVKPMLGATFTDIAMWLFYPFNGPARAKVKFFDISLGRMGEHVGDWEHLTLRISNFDGRLWSVYLAEHSAGIWVSASELEFQSGNTNKFVAYASLHGHALYLKPGTFLQGNDGVGVRNDFAKGKMFMDTGANFSVVGAEHLGSAITEPPWLNYCREWGPRVDYDIAEEMQKAVKVLPGKLKTAFRSIVQSLPDEVLKEEGPTGPKMKASWQGDEV